jgi:sugar lactone lactonase YvrE
VRSTTLRPDQAERAREGDLNEGGIGAACRELKDTPLLIESRKYALVLTNDKTTRFLLNLSYGKFVGRTGKKLTRSFWAVEIESRPAAAKNRAALQELKRIADSLASELQLRPAGRSVYQEGIEKTVLVRPEEKLIEPIHVFGGAQGGFIEQFDLPDAVAFTLDGRLVAGDTDNARFKIYTVSDRSVNVQIVGRVGTGTGEFGHDLVTTLPGGRKIHDQVQGIAVSAAGLIHVIDQGNMRIQVFDPEGRPLPERAIRLRYCPKENPECADGLVYPTRKKDYRSLQGLAVDAEGAVYLSDKGTARVYKFRPDGTYDPAFRFDVHDRATGEPILREPESLAIHREKLFFADERNGNIKIFNRNSGRLIGAFGTEWFGGHVEGLAVLHDYLFAVDSNQNRFVVFDIKGEQPVFVHAFAGDFESADGIAIDPTGKFLAIADQGNFRILLYSLPEILESVRAKTR